MELVHVNPDSLPKSPAFSQAVLVKSPAAMLYVGGQNGISADGSLAGDDIATQTEQALANVIAVLASVGASPAQVAKLTIYIVQGQDVRAGFAASQKVWGPHPTAITVLIVAGLAVPGALVEIDAVCAVDA
jgi:2-iminobutanoate/2-iminopropanoate deaminase